jgi:uncharacterized membrane protein
MTSNGGSREQGEGLIGSLSKSPIVGQLGEAAREYAKARGQDAVKKIGSKLTDATGSLTETAAGGGFKGAAVKGAVQRVAQGDSPVKAAVGGVGSGIKEKVSGLFGRKKSGGSGNKKFMSIIEDINVGVPVDVAYDQWTQYQEFASFMKGVESVDQTDDVNSNWRAKVFKSRRNWKATVTEQIPDRKIAWTSDGAKGTTKGVVTFHPLADDLTQILLVMEYYPQGLFEKTGNIWRAQGRRARLDLKHFRRFIMQRGEATGSWRGEIRDGEVVRTPEEVEEDERAAEEQEEQGAEGYEGEEPEEGEEEPEEGEEESEEEAAEYEEPEGEEGEYEEAEAEAEEGEEEEPEEGEEEPEEEAAEYEEAEGATDEGEGEGEAEEGEAEEGEAEEEPRAAQRRPRPARRGRRREPARAR